MEKPPFFLQKNNIFALPIIHYNMEMAAEVRLAYKALKPDCIAVELAETMQLQLLHAASRLPDISVVITYDTKNDPLYYLCEPCDPAFEALRSALEANIPAFCVDLDVDYYPEVRENMPDPYSIHRIGLKNYYKLYIKSQKGNSLKEDKNRELHMARRLKELSLSYDKVLFVGGMSHVQNVLDLVDRTHFPEIKHAERETIQLCTLTEDSCRDVLAEFGWVSTTYEKARSQGKDEDLEFPPDRQKVIFQLCKLAGKNYVETTGHKFPGYHLRNVMKFIRNYALISGQLMPDLYKILSGAKGCVDHNYAYEVWELASSYPYRRNIDGLQELDLSIDDVWGQSKIIRFHLKQKSRKNTEFEKRAKNSSSAKFYPPGPFSLCSYPPEDVVIERFGNFLKKKGTDIFTEEAGKTIPFSSSLEDGIDSKETIRHWHEQKLFVKVRGKPPGGVGSIVMIFDEEKEQEGMILHEKYPWQMTWLGEHAQESDMAFYASPLKANVVGPGISRCEYGGFMMSYPPRRMYDVWSDPDYSGCQTKAEVLLIAAIDYAVKPLIVYVAAKPPRKSIKSFASRYGKKVIYIPIGQLSPVTLNKLRIFHVLDGHQKREIAGDYIY